ncbi:MAG: hypothetical protein JWR32_2685 [Mycobacterium sp.]|jgi:uncharacterized protein YjbJ (UPF0337 family)|nr:hypothetical protein [Mycobacterium sp.]
MTEHNKADQARKGLIDSVKGKAKEFAGAVTGNDSLTAEGQLEQTQAQERKEANSVEAVADAEAAQAHADATEAKREGAEDRIAVNAETAAVENSVRTQQAAQKRAAEQAGQRDAATGMTQAELDAQREVERVKAEERAEVGAAAEEVVDAVDKHQTSVQEATRAEAEADRIRQQADSLTNEADLS